MGKTCSSCKQYLQGEEAIEINLEKQSSPKKRISGSDNPTEINIDTSFTNRKRNSGPEEFENLFPQRIRNSGPFYPIEPKTESIFVYNINQTINIIENGKEIETILKIKAVNLPQNKYFNKYTIIFDSQEIIKNMECNVENGAYDFDGRNLSFNFKLKNNETLNVEFKYQSLKNGICKYYRNEFIGIQKIYSGAVGKYIVNIPKEYSVISEENDIFYPEIKNKKYIWEGVIPKEGINEFFRISHSTAKWEASISQEFETKYQNDHIRFVEVFTPKFYYGGNLTNEGYTVKCSLKEGIDNNIIVDEGKRYRFVMKDVNSEKAFFQIISKFTVNIHLPWKFDFDENSFPKLEEKEKEYFKKIAERIIKEDKSNYPIFYKLGKYVNKYLKYNKQYTGRELTAREIYNQKEGVCSHFTTLYNALLNSINIPAVYVSGMANNGESGKTQFTNYKDEKHAWTLAKINKKWIPLDATWGILNGILPVSHVFQCYFNFNIQYTFSGREEKKEIKELINYLGN